MGWSIATQPTLDPQALQDVKQQVRQLSNSFDDELTRLLVGAVKFYQEATNRQFLTATAVYTRERFPRQSDRIYLAPSPLVSVTSLTYIDGNGVVQTWSNLLYDVITNESPGYITPAWDERYPDNSRDLTITYEVGYGSKWSTVDEHLRQLVLMEVDQIYTGRDWSSQIEKYVNHARVGDDFHAYP